jgi:hypothetical protein
MALAATLVLCANPAVAQTTIACCSVSSDQYELIEPTHPAQLQADFSFELTSGPVAVAEGDLFELTLAVANRTDVSGFDALFNINAIFFNGMPDVLSLALVSVTDDIGGLNGGPRDATASWGHAMVPPGSQGAGTLLEKAESVGGMDDFRFSLWEGQGLNDPNVIQSGETSEFVLNVLAPSGVSLSEADFDVVFVNKRGKPAGQNVVAAKFVSCAGLDCVAPDDSAFGGSADVGGISPPAPVCEDLGAAGDACDADADCCSNKCRGREGKRTCK